MKTQILFRLNSENQEEFEIASSYFDVVPTRTLCHDSLVIGRYSVLPFYHELAIDLLNNGSCLVNSINEHLYISKMHWAYEELPTPKTYTDDTFYQAPEGQYVVKGKTNSRKFFWNKAMFAKSKKEALNIAADLAGDSLIGPQGIVYREYTPLIKLEEGLNGLPFSYEFRFFFYRTELLCHGFYWSIAEKTSYIAPYEMVQFAKKCAKEVSLKTNFFVLDIGQGVNGEYYLIEVNDGQMSGLSECDPVLLYSRLKEVTNG
jgi:ATP-grasp domain, R2K clade family 3